MKLDHPDCECPAGTGTVVSATRFDSRYGWLWRRRRCLGCGQTCATYELPTSSIDLSVYEPINPDGRLEQ